MFTLPNFQKKPNGLQTIIDDLELYIKKLGPAHPDYAKNLKELNGLYAMKKGDSRPRIDPNVLLQAGISLIAVLAILQNERLHVITSKALSFVKFK